MARPERNNVDYFPFFCEEGKKMFYIEERYGNDGFATFLKLLRELAKTNFHYLDLSDMSTALFLSAKCKVSKDLLFQIISDLVILGKFDKTLWEENSIIWCQDFIDSIQDAYNRRNNNCIAYGGLLQHLVRLGVRKPQKGTNKDDVNPQTKVEETKGKETKENSFEIFWNIYDKKTGKAKAENKFLKLSLDDISKILDVVGEYVKSTPDVKFRKDPTTWLNGRHWEDEIITAKTNPDKNNSEYIWTIDGVNKKYGSKEAYESDKKTWSGQGFKSIKSPEYA